MTNAAGAFYNVPQPFGVTHQGVTLDPFAAEWFNNNPNSGWQLWALANPLGCGWKCGVRASRTLTTLSCLKSGLKRPQDAEAMPPRHKPC